MRIVVNDVAATPDAGGIFSILSDFYNDVLNDDRGHEWIFILAGKYFAENENVKIITRPDLKQSWLKKFSFEFFNGHKMINSLKPDVFVSLQNILTRKVASKSQFVYIDKPLSFQSEKNFSFFKCDERKLAVHQHIMGPMIKYSIRHSDANVIVQSNWLKNKVAQKKLAPKEKIIVETPAIDLDKFKAESDAAENNAPARTDFFYPATSYVYKNHRLLIDAAKIITEKYGLENFSVDFTLKRGSISYSRKIPSQVHFVGQLPREQVISKYRNSTLVFPSYIETLGLPLLEAAMQGGLILASDTDFSHELLADYGDVHYFNFKDSEELAELMVDVIRKKIITHNNPLSIANQKQRKLSDDILQRVKADGKN